MKIDGREWCESLCDFAVIEEMQSKGCYTDNAYPCTLQDGKLMIQNKLCAVSDNVYNKAMKRIKGG